MKPIKAIPTIIVTVVTLLVIGAAVLPGLRIKLYPNDSNPPDTAAFVMEETTTENHILFGQLRLRLTNGLATVTYVNANTNRLFEVQTNGVRIGLVTNLNFIGATGYLSGATAIVSGGSGGGSVTGTTNFLNLSVQAAKLPLTNYTGIDAGNQDWELIYYKTNAEGSISSLSGTWQFIVPADYATNSMLVRIYSTLLQTNGPNTSNTIFRASVLRATPSDATVDLHTNVFGAPLSGTNTWTASYVGTNKMKSVTIALGTNSMLAAGDWCLLKLDRDASDDTYGGVTSVVGLQLEYTRP